MATELIANSPTPGSVVALTTLAAPQASTSSLSFTMAAAAPAALRGAGSQFRTVIDSEIVIFDAANVSTTTWTALSRGAEGSTAATHVSTTQVLHYLTAGALQALIAGATGGSLSVQGAMGTALGATQTINFASTRQQIDLAGTLNAANCVITYSNRVANCSSLIMVLQDATGGRTLGISDGTATTSVNIATTPGSLSMVLVKCPDATNIEVTPLGAGPAVTPVASVSVAGTLTPGTLQPVNATNAAVAMALPTGQPLGTQVFVEKEDASANLVNITGSIRGVGSSTFPLKLQLECQGFVADSAGSWWPFAGHKTLSSLQAMFVPGVASIETQTAGLRVQTQQVNQLAYPAQNASVQLFSVAGAGVVRQIQLTHSTAAMAETGHLQIFVDGETTPSFDIEWGTALGVNADSLAHPSGGLIFTRHTATSITNGGSNANTCSGTLRYPLPFSNGVVVKWLNTSSAGTGSNQIYGSMQYVSGALAGITDRWRLRSVAGFLSTSPAFGPQTQTIPFFALSSAGYLVHFAYYATGATDVTYLERPFNVFVDGEGTPSYRGNAEDWWDAGYYYANNKWLSSPRAFMTATNLGGGNGNGSGGIDLLEMCGGIKFSSQISMNYGLVSEIKAINFQDTNVSMACAGLFYQDLSLAPSPPTQAVPAAPTSVSAVAGNAQATVSFQTSASNGGNSITGYTATSTPGSITASAAVSPILVPGLTNGTAYTFTVHATNGIGNSAESAASNSVTPSPPVTLLSDVFSRYANTTLLGGQTPSTGAIWALATGDTDLKANGVSGLQTQATAGNYLDVSNLGVTTYQATVAITTSTVSGRGDVGEDVLCTSNGSGGFNIAWIGSSNKIQIFRKVVNTAGPLSAALGWTTGSQHTIQTVVTPTTLTVFADGVSVLSYTLTATEQTAVTGATYAGPSAFVGASFEDGTSIIRSMTVTN